MGASPMPYALCPMPYALCPMPYEYLMLLIKAIVFGVDGWKKPPLPSRKLYKNQPIPHDITTQNEWKKCTLRFTVEGRVYGIISFWRKWLVKPAPTIAQIIQKPANPT